MHKYHWADVCTALRFACAGALISGALLRGAPEWALAVFALGELMDALDGSLARRYPYPDDGYYRWWRDDFDGRLPEIYDQVADILLAVAALIYVGLNVHLGLALWLGGLGICIALPVQIWRVYRIRLIPDEEDDPLRVRVILVRRVLYLLGIVVIIGAMLGAIADIRLRVWLVSLGFVVAVALVGWKADRLKRDKPPKSEQRDGL